MSSMSTVSTVNKVTSNGSSVRHNATGGTKSTVAQRASRSTSLARGIAASRDASNCSSPTNTDQIKKIPPIKTPVGLAKGPELTKVQSKIGSLSNIKHRPAGGEKKVPSVKLEWNASSKIGSLENATHKPRGGDVVVPTQKLQWNTSSKVGSLANLKHKAGGGNVQIFDEKYKVPSSASTSRSASEVRPTNNRDTPAATGAVAAQSAAAVDESSNVDQGETNGSSSFSFKKCAPTASARGAVSCTKTVTSASASTGAPASKVSSSSSTIGANASSSSSSAAAGGRPMPAVRKASTEHQSTAGYK